MDGETGGAGLAALAICESMLLSLTENRVIDAAEARAILADAATVHRNAAVPLGSGGPEHAAAALLIERMLKGVDPVRPPA
jgi:hypothetical protein